MSTIYKICPSADYPVHIASKVAITFSDVNTAGLRAVCGLSSGHTQVVTPLKVEGLGPLSRLLEPSSEANQSLLVHPLSLINFFEENTLRVSMLVLNAEVGQQERAHLLAALLDFLEEHALQPDELVIYMAASVRLNVASPTGCFVTPLNIPEASVLTISSPPLPPTVAIQEPMTGLLVHMLIASGRPAYVILAPGFKPGVKTSIEDIMPSIKALGSSLQELLGLHFDADSSRKVASANFSASQEGSLMYM